MCGLLTQITNDLEGRGEFDPISGIITCLIVIQNSMKAYDKIDY